jgi:glycerol-3-phosphate dehydrogenase
MKLNKFQKASIIRAIMNDVPPVDKTARRLAVQAAIVKAMSPDVRKVFKSSPGALRTSYVGDVIDTDSYQSRSITVGDVTEAKLEEILKPYKEEDNAVYDARRKLQAIVEGCSTLKQLQTLLPEFKQYMPTEAAPTKNLPAVANMVADLSKLGWPKSKTSTN